MIVTTEILASIKVLWRQHDGMMNLWGIPHEMNQEVQQTPRDLHAAGNTDGWIWLGTPGWWGSKTPEEIETIKTFLSDLGDLVPDGPGEYCTVPDHHRRSAQFRALREIAKKTDCSIIVATQHPRPPGQIFVPDPEHLPQFTIVDHTFRLPIHRVGPSSIRCPFCEKEDGEGFEPAKPEGI